jgi:hypothetical protein
MFLFRRPARAFFQIIGVLSVIGLFAAALALPLLPRILQVEDELQKADFILPLAGWHINRKLGIALFIFTGMILLGSIHLAWHYAIDGYAGIAIALIAWWVSGIVARKWEAGAWAQDYARALTRYGTRPPAAHR